MAHKRNNKDLKKQIIKKLNDEGTLYCDVEEIMNCKANYMIDLIFDQNNHNELLQKVIIDVKKFQHAISDKNTYNGLIKRGVFKEKKILGAEGFIVNFKELLNEGIVVSLFHKGEGEIKPSKA